MKFIVWAAALVLSGFLIIQLYNLYGDNAAARKELEKTAAEAAALAKENKELIADLEYYAIPENLAKELKANFDYKKPGEKLIKIQ